MKNIIIQVINNEENFYEGDLRHYFKVVFNSSGIRNPYHNLRHYLHTTCSVYTGGKYEQYPEKHGKRSFRALLIAALFHDFNHSEKTANDKEEIGRAIDGVRRHILGEDEDLLPEIDKFIRCTQYPHDEHQPLSLGEQLLRDADMCQNFSDVWMQQIIIGLSCEFGILPIELLRNQLEFLPKIVFLTDWAKKTYDTKVVEEKISYVKELLEILE